jgi:hypothetical protein
MSQGNSFISFLNKQKCHFFSFIKSENRRAEQFLFMRLVPVGRVRISGKGVRG